MFVKLLRQLSPMSSATLPRIIFTHGDLQPHNIMVDMVGKKYVISGLLDWEYSGFYPEYYETVRSTNCLALNEHNDWYLFLLECISPKRYRQWWLFDMVREKTALTYVEAPAVRLGIPGTLIALLSFQTLSACTHVYGGDDFRA